MTARARWIWVGAWGAAAAVLAAVFAAWLDPHFAVDIANRIGACF